MEEVVQEIYEKFSAGQPGWEDGKSAEKLKEDIHYLLLYGKKDQELYLKFLHWQKALLEAVEIPLGQLKALLGTIAEVTGNAGAALDPEQLDTSLISQTNPEANLPHRMAEFHVGLFDGVDPHGGKPHQAKLASDANYLLQFLNRSEKDPGLFLAMVQWQLDLVEALGISRISLIRYLVTMKLFSKGPQKKLLDESIRNLTRSGDTAENQTLTYGTEPEIAEAVTDLHVRFFHPIDPISKESDREKILQDTLSHLQFLDQALVAKSSILFSEYIGWVESTLSSLGMEKISIIRYLVSLKMVLKSSFLAEGLPFIDEAIRSVMKGKNEENEEDTFASSEHARTYLSYLLKGERRKATEFIMNLIESGKEIRDVYIDIFQAVQYEIGMLWEKNKVSVAQEHYCTATTQMIMSMLYPRIFSGKSIGKSVVATSVGSELHEMGIRMVADFMEMEGWDTYYLGANTPTPAILQSIDDYTADVLAISVTLTPNIKKAAEIIKAARNHSPGIKILVGGYPFMQDENLWRTLGADGHSKSATEVHKVAFELVG